MLVAMRAGGEPVDLDLVVEALAERIDPVRAKLRRGGHGYLGGELRGGSRRAGCGRSDRRSGGGGRERAVRSLRARDPSEREEQAERDDQERDLPHTNVIGRAERSLRLGARIRPIPGYLGSPSLPAGRRVVRAAT